MDAVSAATGLHWLVTKANADAGGLVINEKLDRWADAHPDTVAVRTSLGVVRYLSAMKGAAVVLGNSSSGVVETPTFGVPTVNVGDRQKGRPICENVIGCPADESAIEAALHKALSPAFRTTARKARSPYNGGNTSEKIVEILLREVRRPGFGAPKTFYEGELPK